MSAAPCPDDDALIALVEHALEPAAIAAIEGHVDACARCRTTIGHLAAIDDGAAPAQVGRYRLEHVLGEGGMGVVWQAWDPMLERGVAIKLLRPAQGGGSDGAARLIREARALARLQHPNVVAIHDVGEYDGEVFLATELVDGEPMHRWQHERSADEIVAAYVQAARGLAAAHALGLVHRDVKPSNILVGRDGRVRVGDFGLVARGDVALDDTVTAAGAIVGTPAYMAPEQRAGRPATARSDQWSLCLALAEALVGVRPPPGVTATALARGSTVRAPWAAIARGLARDPDARFADVTALAIALEGGGTTARPRGWRIAIAGALIVAGAAGAWSVLGGGGHHASAPPTARELGEALRATLAAAESHDAAACTAAADHLGSLGDAGAMQARTQRAICEMLAGRCDDGRAAMEQALLDEGAPRDASLYVKLWCPIDGDLDRAWTQAAAHEDVRFCRAIEPEVRALATTIGAETRGRYDDDSNLRREHAAQAIGNLGRCFALAHRCDDAARDWALATQVRGAELGHIACR